MKKVILSILLFSILIINPKNIFSQLDSISFGGYNRTFLVHLPTGYSATDSIPLVIVMHGGGGSAVRIASYAQMNTKADAEKFIVVYPEGVKGGVLKIRTWNAGWCCGFSNANNIDDVGFIDTMLNKLIGQYAINTKRIYATGMSNGGFMSYRLACEMPNRIAAIAPVETTMVMPSCNPSKAVPVIHFHSYLDSNVPYLGGLGSGFSNHHNSPTDSVLNAWAIFDSCSVKNDTIVDNSQYTLVKWTNCKCQSEIHYYITTDGGHLWPGNTPGSVFVNATDKMWDFFKNYSLDCGKLISVKETEKSEVEFSLFPNPSTGNFRIKTSVDNFLVKVYNSFGKFILEAENTNTINLSKYANGVYFVSVVFEDKVLIKRIAKLK